MLHVPRFSFRNNQRIAGIRIATIRENLNILTGRSKIPFPQLRESGCYGAVRPEANWIEGFP